MTEPATNLGKPRRTATSIVQANRKPLDSRPSVVTRSETTHIPLPHNSLLGTISALDIECMSKMSFISIYTAYLQLVDLDDSALILAGIPPPTLPFDKYVERLATIATKMLQRKPRATPAGVYNEDDMKTCLTFSVASIEEVLFRGTDLPILSVSSSSLATEIMKYFGASLIVEAGKCYLDAGLTIRVPLIYTPRGVCNGCVADDGAAQAFIEEYNAQYNTNIEYIVVPMDYVEAAGRLSLRASMSISAAGDIVINTTAAKIQAAFGYRHSVYDHTVLLGLLKLALNVSTYKTYGEGNKRVKNAMHHWAIYLYRYCKDHPECEDVVQKFLRESRAIDPIMEWAVGHVDKDIGDVYNAVVSTRPPAHTCTKYTPYDVVAFVRECRIFRQHHRGKDSISAKKLDSYGLGALAGEATSVAQKIGRALSYLQAAKVYGDVAAYGVSRHNWWHEMVIRYAKDHQVEWFDIDNDRSSLPEYLQGRVSKGDVLKLPDLTGKIFLSDAFLDSKQQANSTKASTILDHDLILQQVCEARPLGGIVKMYLTEARGADFHQLGAGLDELITVYSNVELVPGGGPHSPEYFIVFWGLFTEKELGSPDWQPHMEEVRNNLYLSMAAFLYDLVWANKYFNDQIYMGSLVPPPDGVLSQFSRGTVTPQIRGYMRGLKDYDAEREKEGIVVSIPARDLATAIGKRGKYKDS